MGETDRSAQSATGGAPLVSVVIPFFDPPAAFLGEAVDSVFAQTHRPLELILVNDGSCQEISAYAKELVADSSVPALYLEHSGGRRLGSSVTRNVGARSARGEFIAFLDADDVWEPAKLREQVEALGHDRKLAFVFGQTRYWYSWCDPAPDASRDFVADRGLTRAVTIQPPGFIADFLRGRIVVPSASNVMVRRSIFVECGGFENAFHGMYDDQACWVKLSLTHPVAGMPLCWDRYRQHPRSMTAQGREARREEESRRVFLRWVRDQCLDQGIHALEVLEAVGKELWLLGPPAANPARSRQFVRWFKKCWLRVEERLVPARWRQRVWAQRNPAAS